jgi:hypothetical protein
VWRTSFLIPLSMSGLRSVLRSAGSRLSLARKSKSSICTLETPTDCSRTIAHLLPMFLQMLKDEFPDVRLHIISKLEQVNKGDCIDPNYVSSANPIQLSVSSFYLNLSSLPLFSWPRISNGACALPSLNIFLSSRVNWESSSSMSS